MTGFINGKGIVPFCSKPEIPEYLILTWINTIYELKSNITWYNGKFVVVASQCHSPIVSRYLQVELSLNDCLHVKYIPKGIVSFWNDNWIELTADRHSESIIKLVDIFKYIVERETQ